MHRFWVQTFLQMRGLNFTPLSRNLNSNNASICKIRRKIYARMYPTVVVQPDGSTFNIRYHEPRKIIRLPLDLSTLPEDQRRARIEARKPIEKVKVEDEIVDDFDPSQYVNLMKK